MTQAGPAGAPVNQGIAFARSIRALDSDNFRGSKIGLLIAAALIAVWAWWMFAARIPQYETSSTVTWNPGSNSGAAIAYFPLRLEGHIQVGQNVMVRMDDSVVHSQVTSVTNEANGIRVELNLSPGTRGQPKSVEIAVERISPAKIALRAAGLANP